jgi:hypothetical protein
MMGDPATYWLMAVNVAFAAAAITCFAAVVLAAFHLIGRARKRARMAGELKRYLRHVLEAEPQSTRPGSVVGQA